MTDPATIHARPEAQARADAIQHLRRAKSALHAWALLAPQSLEALSTAHATLQDLLADLERIQ